jgi:hypothetical protein
MPQSESIATELAWIRAAHGKTFGKQYPAKSYQMTDDRLVPVIRSWGGKEICIYKMSSHDFLIYVPGHDEAGRSGELRRVKETLVVSPMVRSHISDASTVAAGKSINRNKPTGWRFLFR